jgi:hypothetical protein
MRAINHAMTGAVIGLVVAEPVVALPAALVSHYILDAIPHYDDKRLPDAKKYRTAYFRNLLYADALLCLALIILLATSQPFSWQLAAVCAFLGVAPDFLWLGGYRKAINGAKKLVSKTAYTKFARRIQWFERPIGAVVEVAWFAATLLLLAPFLG